MAAPPPADQDDFEPTSAELRTAFSDALAERHGPNAPLMTKAMRERRDAALGKTKKTYTTVRMRVRFADRTLVERSFPGTATMADVYSFVDTTLSDEARSSGTYTLFQAPPRRDFARQNTRDTLVALGFAPAAVLGIRFDDPMKNSTSCILRSIAIARAPEREPARPHARSAGAASVACRTRPGRAHTHR